jgi:hypothetical protein
MKAFTIDTENNITVYASSKVAPKLDGIEVFASEKALAGLAANWPAARLVEIWNSLPGETAVKKFKDRATATSRIWKALQTFSESAPVIAEVAEPAAVAEVAPAAEAEVGETRLPETAVPKTPFDLPVGAQTPDVSPEAAPSKNNATRAKKAPEGPEAGPREGSKTSQVIAMLKREGGATLEEIMTAMGWQKHTTRAMLSAGGSLTKNHGLVIVSEKMDDKRTYSIKA